MKKGKAKPRLRKNPCVDADWENQWQAIAPKGWKWDIETTYCLNEKIVYLCLVKEV